MKNIFLEWLEKNLTANQLNNLPEKLGISPHALTKIINGKKELTARQLDQLSTLSNKRLDIIFKAYDQGTRKIETLKTQAA